MRTPRLLLVFCPVYITLALFTLCSSFLLLPPSFPLMGCFCQSANEGTTETAFLIPSLHSLFPPPCHCTNHLPLLIRFYIKISFLFMPSPFIPRSSSFFLHIFLYFLCGQIPLGATCAESTVMEPHSTA